MRTAISIPEGIFKRAEKLAKRLGLTRSELYARAVERFVEQEEPRARRKTARGPDELDPITKRLNELYADDTNTDPFLERAALEVFSRTEW